MFYPGQIVVCVIGHQDVLIEGWIYTIKRSTSDLNATDMRPSLPDGNCLVMVNECEAPTRVRENWWKGSRFRNLTKPDLARITQKHKIKETSK